MKALTLLTLMFVSLPAAFASDINLNISISEIKWINELPQSLRSQLENKQELLLKETRDGALRGLSVAAIQALGEIEIEKVLERVRTEQRNVILPRRNDSEISLSALSTKINALFEKYRRDKYSVDITIDNRTKPVVSTCYWSGSSIDRQCYSQLLKFKINKVTGGLMGIGGSTLDCEGVIGLQFQAKLVTSSNTRTYNELSDDQKGVKFDLGVVNSGVDVPTQANGDRVHNGDYASCRKFNDQFREELNK